MFARSLFGIVRYRAVIICKPPAVGPNALYSLAWGFVISPVPKGEGPGAPALGRVVSRHAEDRNAGFGSSPFWTIRLRKDRPTDGVTPPALLDQLYSTAERFNAGGRAER